MWSHIAITADPLDDPPLPGCWKLTWVAECCGKTYTDHVVFTDPAAFPFALAVVQEVMALTLEDLVGPRDKEKLH